MVALTREELALLHIVGCEKLTRRALRAVQKGAVLFPPRSLPHLYLFFKTFLKCLKKNRTGFGRLVVNKQVFAADLLEALEGSQMISEQAVRCKLLLEEFMQLNKELPYEEGLVYLRTLVENFVQRQASSALGNSAAFVALRKTIDRGTELLAELSKDTPKEEPAINLLESVPQLMTKRTPIPFGVPYLDYATCGGACTKEMALIGGGTGGGKTMCATDVACAQARMGNLTLWFTFEQSFNNDISERILANMTGIARPNFRNKSFSELAPEQQQLYFSAVAGMSNLIGIDFSSPKNFDPDDLDDFGGAHSIEKQIIRVEERTHRKVRFVILDWFGPKGPFAA